jgi:excisionase family DNA binding protein
MHGATFPGMMKQPDALGVTLTPREVAERLQVSRATLERLRASGKGPRFIKIGVSIRYPLSDLEAWLSGDAA